jgi:hypothetical protein
MSSLNLVGASVEPFSVNEPAVSLDPALQPRDTDCAYWIAQATLRLRREIGWCWHQRADRDDPRTGALPPFTDPAQDSLDLTRYRAEKLAYMQGDVTARYLTEEMERIVPPRAAREGYWRRASVEAELEAAAQFVLALALAARLDSSFGPVLAACHNDASRPYPTLALAQRLWDDPLAIVACADPAHPLFRYGLIAAIDPQHGGHWQQALDIPSAVALTLVDPDAPPPSTLEAIAVHDAIQRTLPPLPPRVVDRAQVVPVCGKRGADFVRFVAQLVSREDADPRIAKLADDVPCERATLAAIATTCWLQGLDVVLPEHWFAHAADAHDPNSDAWSGPVLALPVRWFAPCESAAALKSIPEFVRSEAITLPALDHGARVEHFRQGLGARAHGLDAAITEAARRFRCEADTIEKITAPLAANPSVTAEALFARCQGAVSNELEHLAQRVKPRFRLDDLVLPKAQALQLEDTIRSMRALATVHYAWGTADVWNEAGLAVLFCGPPGTGKTMASEALAAELDMPMYRIDLSQVVNKYIGETEKNLKRIFDAAETADCVLLFDEADALFGKRTEVKDAHDRYANIEVSYLLERMERFKGLAVLATNRRKDLDEAFTRRLRAIVEFPLPGPAERERIWRRVFPAAADVADIDFAFLANTFQIAGGHIRSIAFNACLLAARPDEAARVSMADVLVAVKRELEKMNRPAGRDAFGRHAGTIAEYLA